MLRTFYYISLPQAISRDLENLNPELSAKNETKTFKNFIYLIFFIHFFSVGLIDWGPGLGLGNGGSVGGSFSMGVRAVFGKKSPRAKIDY